jgi:Holliday junction resolvase
MTAGANAERELSNTLEDEFGFRAMPAGGSGSGTDRARPDVIAGRRSETGVPGATSPTLVAIEVKKRTSDWPQAVHLDGAEIRNLWDFASGFGATPWVVIRPHRGRSDQDWHCYPAADLGTTDAGNRAIRQADLPGATLAEVVGDE